jgi:hypothetical protein
MSCQNAVAMKRKRRRKEAVAEELRAYARAAAGTGADLDEALERAGVEELRRVTSR